MTSSDRVIILEFHFTYLPNVFSQSTESCTGTDVRKQVYVTLSAMEKWAMVDDNRGMNLSTLYDPLREQFQHPDDPWCKETLERWNE